MFQYNFDSSLAMLHIVHRKVPAAHQAPAMAALQGVMTPDRQADRLPDE